MRASRYRMTISCHGNTILCLLRRIVLAIKLISFHRAICLISKDRIRVQIRDFMNRYRSVKFSNLKFSTRIGISNVIPTTCIRSKGRFAQFRLKRTLFLIMTISVVIYQYRLNVIRITTIIPCTMFFISTRITRLCKGRMFRCKLPCTTNVCIVISTRSEKCKNVMFGLMRSQFLRVHRIRLRVIMSRRLTPVNEDSILSRFLTIYIGTSSLYHFLSVIACVRFSSNFLILNKVVACL